jgi:NADP-dependent 3-hydroxy acid dehydrogenase YdfG
MTQILAGKVALVTGASSGIGHATALALAEAGAAVAVSARRAERLLDLVARIEAMGGQAIALPGDVAVEADAVKAVTDTVDRLGRLDVLVNSAGLIQAGGVEHADTAEWRRVMDVNLMGTLYTCKQAIGPMRAQGGGDIVNISSISARRAAVSKFAAYAPSKHALNVLSEGLRQEVGGYGIRVCVIEPGATSTEVAEGMSDPAFRDMMRSHVGKEEAVLPSEVAAAILFVLSQPARVNISELLIRPTADTAPM